LLVAITTRPLPPPSIPSEASPAKPEQHEWNSSLFQAVCAISQTSWYQP
jgi:hypothetical protein